MLHRITGRAVKCGPAAISAIAGVPTHEAAAVIRRLFDRRAVNAVFIDELAAALRDFGWAPEYALRHPNYRERRFARREEVWERIFAAVPFDVRAMTVGTFLDAAPSGTWAISASNHFVAYGDERVADIRRLVLAQANPLVPREPRPRPRCPAARPRSRPLRARAPSDIPGNRLPQESRSCPR